MKKIIIVIMGLFLFMPLSCSAKNFKIPKAERQQYKVEMEQAINTNILTLQKQVDTSVVKAKKIQTIFINDKNQMKRNHSLWEELGNIENEINTAEFKFYLSLINITDKYISIKNSLPSTDYAGTLSDFIRPYITKNKIDYTKIDKQIAYNMAKVQEIEDIRTEIYNYSKRYEENKANNFYNKKILPILQKVQNTEPTYLNSVMIMHMPLSTKTYYWANPQIIQMFPNGFLADVAPLEAYAETVIFVNDSSTNKLLLGDNFFPCLPLKFTGKYLPYKTILGENKIVPIFTVFIPAHMRPQSLPQITEHFYFANKPTYQNPQQNSTFWDLQHIEVLNEKRAYYTGNPSYIWK